MSSVDCINVPPGFHFEPTDQELIVDYLIKKVQRQVLPSRCVIERDLYSNAPWAIFSDRDPWEETTDTENVIHVFTRLTMASTNRVKRSTGCGTWHGMQAATEVKDRAKVVIGYKKMFVFEANKGVMIDHQFQMGHWIMYECSLTGSPGEGDYVVCQIKRAASKPLKRSRRSVTTTVAHSHNEEHNREKHPKRVRLDANNTDDDSTIRPYAENRVEHLGILQQIQPQSVIRFSDATTAIWQPQHRVENLAVVNNIESDSVGCFEDASYDNPMTTTMGQFAPTENGLYVSTRTIVELDYLSQRNGWGPLYGTLDATTTISQSRIQTENPWNIEAARDQRTTLI